MSAMLLSLHVLTKAHASRSTRAAVFFLQQLLADMLLVSPCLRSFGRDNLLALASTCKLYAKGLQDEVRRFKKLATALVAWPASGAVVMLAKIVAERLARDWSSAEAMCHLYVLHSRVPTAPFVAVTESARRVALHAHAIVWASET